MKKIHIYILLSVAVICSFISLNAQNNPNNNNEKRKFKVERPDLKKIQEETLNPKSPYYFPTLYKRYLKNDTSLMTPTDFRMLYLGYMFQEDYDPYRVSEFSGITDELRMRKNHSKAEIDSIRKYAELSLLDNPFDLRQMSFLVHVLKEQQKNTSAKLWEYRLGNLLGAIKSTGTGKDVDNAWYVIYPMHEYDMVQLMGYQAVDAKFQEANGNQYDYLVVQPDGSPGKKSAQGFYFNVTVPQEQYILKHPEDIDPNDYMPVQDDDPDDIPAEQ